MDVSTAEIEALQKKPERIRNLCILAHVDHGKTTLSDHLIGANGLIHPRLLGELRYLDSRDDEQIRGITMKSSSISLLYVRGAHARPGGPRSITLEEKLDIGYLINLIDSPGHVDFCSEVSSAARLSDGGLVLVDAVEGVCIQTHAVLRQAWEEKLQLCLVINKMDRLVLELRLSPAEAYERVRGIITHVNMIVSGFLSERHISEAEAVLAVEDMKAAAGAAERAADGGEGEEEEELEFSPAKGNVAFASAHDGWAFTTAQFAAQYASRMGFKAAALEKALWGDYGFNPKTKLINRIKAGGATAKLKPLFVQLALEPLWKAYSACDHGADSKEILGKIVKGLGLSQVSEREVAQPDSRAALRTVLRAWLPLSEAVLGMAATHLPSPLEAGPAKVQRLLPPLPDGVLPAEVAQDVAAAQAAVAGCATGPTDPLIAYVAKMVAVPAGALPRSAGDPAPRDAKEEVFLGFGRVFSGVLKEGRTVHVLSAAYDPAHPDEQRQEVTVTAIYLMMGRGLERLKEAPAGTVVAIAGLDTAILKSATLAGSPAARPLAAMMFQAAPIVRVAVEPKDPSEMGALVDGLRLLNRADPFVEVTGAETGEWVVGAAGEVHLETCIKDLRERFARIQLEVSPPLVAFRESVCDPREVSADAVGAAPPRVVPAIEATTANGRCTIRVRALPLPAAVATALDESEELLRRTLGSAAASSSGSFEGAAAGTIGALHNRLQAAAEEAEALPLLERAWLLGPKRVGANLLLLRDRGGGGGGLWELPPGQVVPLRRHQASGAANLQAEKSSEDLGTGADTAEARAVDLPFSSREAAAQLGFARDAAGDAEEAASGGEIPAAAERVRQSVESGVVAGFQLATAAGPLCDEPLWGVALELDARLNLPASGEESAGAAESAGGAEELDLAEDVYGPFSGQVTSVVRQACRAAVMEAGPRLVEAMFLCEVSTSAEALSGVYAVLGKRRARVLREEMHEGSALFSILAHLPAEASFGLAGDMRRGSSGAASASLMLSHWERLQVDPFFVPTTEEEREEWGEAGQGVGAANLAKGLINAVRERKGLPVERKVVESATKQRTRARKV